jgi:hypothetical protein
VAVLKALAYTKINFIQKYFQKKKEDFLNNRNEGDSTGTVSWTEYTSKQITIYSSQNFQYLVFLKKK